MLLGCKCLTSPTVFLCLLVFAAAVITTQPPDNFLFSPVQVNWIIWKPEGGQHFRGDGGFHRRHCILVARLISYPSSPLEDSDGGPVQRQPAQLLHQGTYKPQNAHTTRVDANLGLLEFLCVFTGHRQP